MSTSLINPSGSQGPIGPRGLVRVGPETSPSRNPRGPSVDEVTISPTARQLADATEKRPEELELRLSPRELRRLMEPTESEAMARKRSVAEARRETEARARRDRRGDDARARARAREAQQAPVVTYGRKGPPRPSRPPAATPRGPVADAPVRLHQAPAPPARATGPGTDDDVSERRN